jgi:hypothetical protein
MEYNLKEWVKPLLVIRNQAYWKVEKILQRKEEEGNTTFLVKWSGFSTATWHFSDQLGDVADMLYKHGYNEGSREMLEEIINHTHNPKLIETIRHFHKNNPEKNLKEIFPHLFRGDTLIHKDPKKLSRKQKKRQRQKLSKVPKKNK